jgi:hypothetical protein
MMTVVEPVPSHEPISMTERTRQAAIVAAMARPNSSWIVISAIRNAGPQENLSRGPAMLLTDSE